MQIDSREIRLAKWNIPRDTGTGYLSEGEVYHALGYFDMIGIKKIEIEDEDDANYHPLVRAYNHSERLRKKFFNNFFVQEIKAFTNIAEDPRIGFTGARVNEFWKRDSLILCFSMIQLYLEKNIDSILDKIKEVFSTTNYLYYFTLDYSGIIIFAKDISIKDYIELLFKINYSNEGDEKLVKDTFSIYGFQKEIREEIFAIFSRDEWSNQDIESYFDNKTEYEIAVNMSVQNYSAYSLFREELLKYEKKYGYVSKVFKLSGRHDISLVNKRADMVWLLVVQYMLDRYAQESVGDFYAYESFVKVELQENYLDQKYDFKIYEPLIERIKKVYEEFAEKAEKCGYSSYCIPVKEVCASVINILKNGFAEDFVFCIYQPFVEFLRYMGNKIDEQERSERGTGIRYSEEFDKCFCSYFDGLNALANSAMHTDRQFIRATSFSDIFYDVPPKIMAFYVAIIYRIRGIMQTEKEKEYTFFMSPSFSDEVSVNIISYEEKKMPCDRILKVSINERSLYNPESVVTRMAHEIAHFVGGELRQRSMRMEGIIDTIVYIILQQIIHKDFSCDRAFRELKENIVKNFIEDCGIACDKDNYSIDLKSLHRKIVNYMANAEIPVHVDLKKYIYNEIDRMLETGKINYLKKIIEKKNKIHEGEAISGFRRGLSLSSLQKEYLSKIILQDMVCEIKRIGGKTNKESVVFSMGNTIMEKSDSINKYAKSLISLYSETYSDLHMILLLGISYEKYLRGFVCDEKIDVDNVKNSNEDISRIAVISQLMQEKGNWEKEISNNIPEEIAKLHNAVKEFQTDMQRPSSPYAVQNQSLKEYLDVCMARGREHYNKKEAEVSKLRSIIDVLTRYDDAKMVYCTICNVISEYSQTLKG